MIDESTKGKRKEKPTLDRNAILRIAIALFFVVLFANILASTAAAFELSDITDKFSGLGEGAAGFASSKWVVMIVNGAILGIIGYVIVSIMFKDLKEQKTAIILGVIGVALLIAYQIYQANITDFLWKIPEVKDFMRVRVLVNLIVVVSILYILYFVLELKPKELNSKPFDVVVFVIILLIAFNAVKPVPKYSDETYHYIWEWESIVPYRFFLLGDSGCTYYQYETDQYYQEDDKWYRDAVWGGEEDWFGDDLITEPRVIEELTKAKEVRERIKDVTDRNELTNPDERSFYDTTKDWPEDRVTIKSKVDKYCYTAASVQELLDKKSKDLPYEPTEKEPSAEEISATGGFGILRGSHLIMLILTMIVLSWVAGVWKWFEGSTKLPYVLSFIVAAMIAHSGIGMQQFAWLIQILIILGLFKAFGGDFDKFFGKEKKFSTWIFAVLSIMIVVSVTEMVKPGYGLPLLRLLTIGNIYGLFESPMHLIVGILQVVLTGAVLFAPWKKRFKIPIIIFLLFGIKLIPGFGQYGLDGTKATVVSLVMLVAGFIGLIWLTTQDERAKMILGRGWGYIKNRFWDFANETGIPAKMGWDKWTESHMPGLLPFYVSSNIELFYYMMNLCKRTWIYYQYWNVVKGVIGGENSPIKDIYAKMERYFDLPKLRRGILDYRSAPSNFSEFGKSKYQYKFGKDKKKEGDEEEEEQDEAKEESLGGWTSHHQIIAKLYNENLENAMKARAAVEMNDMIGFRDEMRKLETKTAKFEELREDINTKYKGYTDRIKAYSAHSLLRSKMIMAIDMANCAGFYDHTYLFAKPHAKICYLDDKGEVIKDSDGNEIIEIAGIRQEDAENPANNIYWEVDKEGKFLDDKSDHVTTWKDESSAHAWENAGQVYEGDFESNRKSPQPEAIKTSPTGIKYNIRKLLDPRDAYTYENNLPGHSANNILDFMNAEWDLWLKDMQWGWYHNRSRSVYDYIREYSRGNYHDAHILPQPNSKIYDQNPSFDLRILANPGIFSYWGRRDYKQIGEQFGYTDNPLPWISLDGITQYLKYEFEQSIEQADEMKKWGKLFPAAGDLTEEKQLIATLAEHFSD